MIRINRCIIGYSRRDADSLIAAGRIKINGTVPSLGAKVNDGDIVTLDNKEIDWKSFTLGIKNTKADISFKQGNGFIYLKVWKPINTISTTPKGDSLNIIEQLGIDKKYKERLFPVGRLDKTSTGLLLFTSNPLFQTELLGKNRFFPKTYEVLVKNPPTVEDFQKWKDGLTITVPVGDSKKKKKATLTTLPTKVVELEKDADGKALVEFTLYQGLNRQIHRMVGATGNKVLSIFRTSFCGIYLDDLPKEGSFKELNEHELSYLTDLINNARKKYGSVIPGNNEGTPEEDAEMKSLLRKEKKSMNRNFGEGGKLELFGDSRLKPHNFHFDGESSKENYLNYKTERKKYNAQFSPSSENSSFVDVDAHIESSDAETPSDDINIIGLKSNNLPSNLQFVSTPDNNTETDSVSNVETKRKFRDFKIRDFGKRINNDDQTSNDENSDSDLKKNDFKKLGRNRERESGRSYPRDFKNKDKEFKKRDGDFKNRRGDREFKHKKEEIYADDELLDFNDVVSTLDIFKKNNQTKTKIENLSTDNESQNSDESEISSDREFRGRDRNIRKDKREGRVRSSTRDRDLKKGGSKNKDFRNRDFHDARKDFSDEVASKPPSNPYLSLF